MRIAYIVCTFPPYFGGIGNSAYQLALTASSYGHEITVFTPKYKARDGLKNEQIKVDRLTPAFAYGNGAFLYQLFSRLDGFDIVHLHYPFFGTSEVVWAAKLFKKKFKLIIHYHMDVTGLSPIAKVLSLPEKLIRASLLAHSDIIICSSIDYIKNSQLNRYFEKHKNKFRELPFGVDSNKFTPRENKGRYKKKILFVGGLDRAHYFKGVEVLLKAAANLKLKEDWSLVIVGDGELKPEYIKLANKLKISDKVNFTGSVDNKKLISIYQGADIFILPSINKNEAFGIVLLEAMSCSLPVIASRLPGVRTVFTDGAQGLYVKPGDVNDLFCKIEKLLINNENRKSMGKAGRQLAKDKYSWERIGQELSKIYNNMLNENWNN